MQDQTNERLSLTSLDSRFVHPAAEVRFTCLNAVAFLAKEFWHLEDLPESVSVICDAQEPLEGRTDLALVLWTHILEQQESATTRSHGANIEAGSVVDEQAISIKAPLKKSKANQKPLQRDELIWILTDPEHILMTGIDLVDALVP